MEVLDVVGVQDVFAMANQASSGNHFRMKTIAEEANEVRGQGGLRLVPDLPLPEQVEDWDVVFVPGGHPRAVLQFPSSHAATLEWIKQMYAAGKCAVSVCFGALILAQAGLLQDVECTTHHQALEELKKIDSRAVLRLGARYVDAIQNKRIATSAGVTAGLDLAFHLLERWRGNQLSERTRAIMEHNGTSNWTQ